MSLKRFGPGVAALLGVINRTEAPGDAGQPAPDAPSDSPHPGMAHDLRQQADAAQSRRDWAVARDLWQQAADAAPNHAGSWVQLGNMLNELERRAEAVAAFQMAGAVDPNLGDAPIGIAGVHERAGRWTDALAAWLQAIDLLALDTGKGSQDRLSHAYGHAAISARLAGQADAAVDLLMRAAEAVPDFHARPAHYLVRAQLMRKGSPGRALDLLHRYLDSYPDDAAARFEIGSINLGVGQYEAGLAAMVPSLTTRAGDISFFRLAADLNERLGRWEEVQRLAEHMADLEPAEARHLERAFTAAAESGRLASARRIARESSRRFKGELALIHRLMRLYEDAKELGRARLLCRWLCRNWPHSRWHQKHYITLTAATRSLPEADRLMRAEIAAGRRDIDVEQAYCDAAVQAGDSAEARRRLEHHAESHPDDEDMQVLLGYVLANAADIETAERHFATLASRTFQSKGALTGLAHMAMRRRDTLATHECWSRLATLYPEDTIGFVEYARSAYELRLLKEARSICEERLRAMPGDVTMGEFYAWLLTAMGSFQEAWDYLIMLRRLTGPSWAVAELSVQCAAAIGVLDGSVQDILATIPAADTREAGRRFYHLVRQAIAVDRPELVPLAVARMGVPARRTPWLAPYLTNAGGPAVTQALDRDVGKHWRRVKGLVSDETARRVRVMSDAEVAALLAQPAHRKPVVHVVNKFEQMRGGSELHALDLAASIMQHAKVRLWAPEMPHPHFSRDHGVQAVDIGRGRAPQGGVVVLIGVYFEIASWISRTHPERVLILYNTFEAPLLFERIEEIYARTGVRPELIFCSDLMQRECGLPGHFEPSPTDVGLFAPASPNWPVRPFTVGRHSRDVVEKHHPGDWRIYAVATEQGGAVRLLGGTCMRTAFPKIRGLELLPARNEGIPEFLKGLDAFVYRTSTWIEPWGRVVIEAMACGLPVLVHERGGYAQVIEHERNGLIFRTTEEGEQLMRRLVTEPALCRCLGQEARRTAEVLLGAEATARLVAFYLATA